MPALGGDRHPPAPPAQAATSASSALADAALAEALIGGCSSQACQPAQPPWYPSSLTAAGKAPLFLGKALFVKTVVATGLHLQTMAWTWFELGKISLYLCAPNPHSLPPPSRAPRGRARSGLRGRALGLPGQHLRRGWRLEAGTDVQRPGGGGPGWGFVGVRVRALARGLGECACTCVHIWVHACVQTRPRAYQRSLALQRGTRLGSPPVGLRQVWYDPSAESSTCFTTCLPDL